MGASPYRGKVIIVTKGGIIQVKTIILTFFFQGKVTFVVTSGEKVVFILT